MSSGAQQDAFDLLAQGRIAEGLKRLSEDEVWNLGEDALPIFLGIPKARGYGECLLLASIAKQTRSNSENRISIIAPPQAASLLSNDKNFKLAGKADDFCSASGKARLPLVELRKFFELNQAGTPRNASGPLDKFTRVGIAWRSASKGASGSSVSDEKGIPVLEFINLLKSAVAVDGRPIELISFQRHISDDDCQKLERSGFKFSIVDQDLHDDIDQSRLAAQIREIDLMITVSTTTAHVSGYLGVRTLVIAKDRGPKQWFWPAQEKTGIRFYPSVDVVVASRESKKSDWWKECIDDARRCIRDFLK